MALELLFTGDNERRRQLVEATFAYSSTLSDPLERNRINALAGRAESVRDYSREHCESGVQLQWEVVAEARRVGAPEHEWEALNGLFYLTLLLGLPDRDQIVARSTSLLEHYPNPVFADALIAVRMCAALIDGQLEQAERLAEETARKGAAHGRRAESMVYASSGHLQVARERVGLGPMVDLLKSLPASDSDVGRPTAGRGLVTLGLAEAGEFAQAVALLERYGSAGFEDLPDDHGLPVARSAFADAAALTGDLASCRHLYDHMLTVADIHQATGGFYLGATARYLANLADVLGRPDEADEWYTRARSEHEAMRTPPWLARGLMDWAESLERRGKHESAVELATEARAVIGDLELIMTRSRAERLINRS